MNERLNEAAYSGEKGGVQLRRYIIEENGTISRKRGSLPVPIIFDSICVYTYAYILYTGTDRSHPTHPTFLRRRPISEKVAGINKSRSHGIDD